MTRCISQVHKGSGIGCLVEGRFSSNKRQSYNSENSQLFSKDNLNDNSKRRKSNHDIIRDKIKLQNYNKSQQSALSESNVRLSKGRTSFPGINAYLPCNGSASKFQMQFNTSSNNVNSNNFHNHLSSV